jgi:3'-phosphoadenosine 5'-phosphosulfate sulfotransferase (PAPS reductase)/FAD synthetase
MHPLVVDNFAGGGGASTETERAAEQKDLFITPRALDEIATDPIIDEAAAARAWFVFSLSGGKDCGAVSALTMRYLDSIGHPRERRIAMHADLGRAEWVSTPAQVEAQARALGLPLVVVRRGAGDLPTRFKGRWELGLAAYQDLRLYNLRGPFASPALKFCQSELKIQVMGPELARRFRGEMIVQITGLRRDESRARAATPVAKVDHRFAAAGNRAGTRMLVWNPGVLLTAAEVFNINARYDIPLAESYGLGCSRHSCAFCIMASIHDLKCAASCAANAPLFHLYVGLEITSTFSFQAARWLGDIAPELLSAEERVGLERAKMLAEERRRLEAAMPAHHRYVAGWPLYVPTQDEAVAILDTRRVILGHHGVTSPYGSPELIIERFAGLRSAGEVRRSKKLAA